jgi:hypothetical protein
MKRQLLFVFSIFLIHLNLIAQRDTLGLTYVKEKFYTDSLGNIYFKNVLPDIGLDGKFKVEFVTMMPFIDWDHYDSLKKYIDLETYHKIKDVYSADKNLVYYFIYNIDGTTIRILKNADPSSFKHIKSDIAIDKNYVFKDGCLVEGADAKGKIKIYNSEYSIAPYFTDGTKVFHNCIEVNEADVMSFRTVLHEASYDAEDKNRKYLRGKGIE